MSNVITERKPAIRAWRAPDAPPATTPKRPVRVTSVADEVAKHAPEAPTRLPSAARLPLAMLELVGRKVVVQLKNGARVEGTFQQTEGAGAWLIIADAIVNANAKSFKVGITAISAATVGHIHAAAEVSP